MAGTKSGYRNRLFHALHAEAKKRHMDHDALHDMICKSFSVHSMSQATDAQLLGIYRQWTGKTLKRRAHLGDPGWQEKPDGLVSGEELIALDQAFALRGLGAEGRANFVRRQLKGRDQIKSRRDCIRVLHAIRAMNERDGLNSTEAQA